MKAKLILLFTILAIGASAQPLLLNGTQVKKDGYTITTNALRQLMCDTSNMATKYYVGTVSGGWNLTGNSGTTAGTNFIGTIDSMALVFKTNDTAWATLLPTGQLKLRTGSSAFFYDSTAGNSEFIKTANLAIGDSAMTKIRFGTDTSISHNNTAVGYWALRDLVNGWGNSAIGTAALTHLIGHWGGNNNPGTPYGDGYENTAIGFGSQHLNDHGYENTSLGVLSLFTSIKPIDCTAIGTAALQDYNDTLVGSTALGCFAAQHATTARGTTAIGGGALRGDGTNPVTGLENTVVGGASFTVNTSGFSNTGLGTYTGNANTTGAGNTYIGYKSGYLNTTANHNVFVGSATGLNSASLSGWMLLGFGGFNDNATKDTTYIPIAVNMKTGGGSVDSSTTEIRLNGKVRMPNGNNLVKGQGLYLVNAQSAFIDYSTVANDTTSGDAATINSVVGRFKKDNSGATFTLTNSFITTNSAISLTANNAAIDASATTWTYFIPAAGSAVIVFNAAPTSDFKMVFKVEN